MTPYQIDLARQVALSLAATVGACILMLDANWMAAMVKQGVQAARPPLFRSPIPLPGGWRRVAWLAGFVFILTPLMIMSVTGVRHMTSPAVQAGLFAAIALVLAVLVWSNVTGRTRTATVAAVAAAVLVLAPYALAGPQGWGQYAVVTGLMLAILGLLFLAASAHRLLFSWRPRTRAGAGVRFVLDGVAAAAMMAAVFWPRFAAG